MKTVEKSAARALRQQGYSINEITAKLGVAKSSVSIWVRDIKLTHNQASRLSSKGFSSDAIEKRRVTRLANEEKKRQAKILHAQQSIPKISDTHLWLIGTMLYWAEGGKTQRMVRFSNGDPEMIKIMMAYFRNICDVDESKFRGYIHIHPHLDFRNAEKYWSNVTDIPLGQFFKMYRKQNRSSLNKRNTLPNGVLDIYVLDTELFLKITGWARGIFMSY